MADETFGITTRFKSHAGAFDPVFFETKGIAGAFLETPPGAIPSISAFADEKVARSHPDWVQVGPDGERADRGSRYFDWSSLCPSREEVLDLALSWAKRAGQTRTGLRLDDAHYARAGYCTCDACRTRMQERNLSGQEWREGRVTAFVRQVREEVQGPLYLTVNPDPYPGHLERNYGLDIEALEPLVDAFIVPVYDLAYSTTYWVENIASGFKDRLRQPFLVELYALQVPDDGLLKAAAVARHYADGVLIAYEPDLGRLKRIQSNVMS